MPLGLHHNFGDGQIHRKHNWAPANAAALAAIVPVAGDNGKVAWQVDTNKFYTLLDYTGPTWQLEGTGAAPGAHAHTLADITDAGTAAAEDVGDFATAAQGAKSDTALQPADGVKFAPARHTHSALDIIGLPRGGGGHVIEDEGTPVPQRANINFTGAGVAVTDAGGKTVVTIPGGGTVNMLTIQSFI